MWAVASGEPYFRAPEPVCFRHSQRAVAKPVMIMAAILDDSPVHPGRMTRCPAANKTTTTKTAPLSATNHLLPRVITGLSTLNPQLSTEKCPSTVPFLGCENRYVPTTITIRATPATTHFRMPGVISSRTQIPILQFSFCNLHFPSVLGDLRPPWLFLPSL